MKSLMDAGQHYGQGMSDVFFEELEILKPDYHLGVSSEKRGEHTGSILPEIEKALISERANRGFVYNDPNSILSGIDGSNYGRDESRPPT